MPFEIISYNWDDFEPGSSDYYMNLQKKVGICVECGYLGSKECISRAKKSLLLFLKRAGAINGKTLIKTNQKFYKIIELYKNFEAPFKKSRDFADFEKMKKKTLVGKEGGKKIYAKEGDVLLFVRDRKEIGRECFLKAKETLLNSNELNGLKEEK
jgi:hypothetical protein